MISTITQVRAASFALSFIDAFFHPNFSDSKRLGIDRMHKLGPKIYSFVYVLIRLPSLALKQHFFCILSMQVRPVSLLHLIHDGRHVGFAIIMQISHTLLRAQTTQVQQVMTNVLTTQMICFTFIECLSPK